LQSQVQALGEIAECLGRRAQHRVFFTKASDLGATLTRAGARDLVASVAAGRVSVGAAIRRQRCVAAHEGPPHVDQSVSPHGGPGGVAWAVCNGIEQRSPAM
jgi:hypothetical protein